MGNAFGTPDQDGYPNEETATFWVDNNYQLVRPEIPQKMKGRIDDAMWSEFTNLVFQAASQVDSEQYKSAYNRFTYFFNGSILSVFIGITCFIVGSYMGEVQEDYLYLLLLGLLLFIVGAYGANHFHKKKKEMHEQFYLYVRQSIDDFLVNLNVKYKNKIYFEKTVYNKSQGFIDIAFKLYVDKVSSRSNKKKKAKSKAELTIILKTKAKSKAKSKSKAKPKPKPKSKAKPKPKSKAKSKVIENNMYNNINIVNNIAQQPLLSQQSQQEAVMVQMPDGKMVRAKFYNMWPVSNIQMNKDQNPSAPALYHSVNIKSPPAYNPNGKKNNEEDEGEGVVTNV